MDNRQSHKRAADYNVKMERRSVQLMVTCLLLSCGIVPKAGVLAQEGSSTQEANTQEMTTEFTLPPDATETTGWGSTETTGLGSTETTGLGSTETTGWGSTETTGWGSTETTGWGSTETEAWSSTATLSGAFTLSTEMAWTATSTDISTITMTLSSESSTGGSASPEDCIFSDWSDCTCNGTGGECISTRNMSCSGDVVEVLNKTVANASCEAIAALGVWAEWSGWSDCSETCDGGLQTRTRLCNDSSLTGPQAICDGDYEDTQDCGTDLCPLSSDEMTYGLYINMTTTMTVGQYNAIKKIIGGAIISVLNSYCNLNDSYNECCPSSGSRKSSAALVYVNATSVFLGGAYKPNDDELEFLLLISPDTHNDLCEDGTDTIARRRKRQASSTSSFLNPATLSNVVATGDFASKVANSITSVYPQLTVTVSSKVVSPSAVQSLFTSTTKAITSTSTATSTSTSSTSRTVVVATTTATPLALIVGASVGGGLGLIGIVIVAVVLVKKSQSKIGHVAITDSEQGPSYRSRSVPASPVLRGQPVQAESRAVRAKSPVRAMSPAQQPAPRAEQPEPYMAQATPYAAQAEPQAVASHAVHAEPQTTQAEPPASQAQQQVAKSD